MKNRDPNRIPDVLQELKLIWEKNPDLRLTQLILNLQKLDNDLYYVEDDALIEQLKKSYANKT